MKDIRGRFAEIEKRVEKLAAENRALKARIPALEQELESTRRRARDSEDVKDLQSRIRKKVERVLRSLETMDTERGEQARES